MPGRYCSSARRRADRGSPPHGAVRSRTKRVAPAHRRFLSPWRVRRTGRQPRIPAVLPRTRAGRSPRHEPRSGASAGLSRVAPHITGGPRHAPRRPSSACVELGRSMSITFQVSAREILVVPRRSASEITEIPRRPCRSSSGCPPSSRDETPSDAPGRTRRAPPRAVCHRGCPPPVDGLTSSSPTPKTLPHLSRALSTGLPTVVQYSVEIGVKHRRASPATGRYDTRTQLVGGVVHSHPQDSCGYSHPRNADDDGGPQGLVRRDKS